MFKRYSFVKILPGYSHETKSRTIMDKYTGLVCQVVKEADAQGYLDVCCHGIGEEVNVYKDRCEPFDRHAVKVTFADGDYIETAPNGTREMIASYYLDNYFERGKVTSVVFHVDVIDPPPVEEKPYNWHEDCLSRAGL